MGHVPRPKVDHFDEIHAELASKQSRLVIAIVAVSPTYCTIGVRLKQIAQLQSTFEFPQKSADQTHQALMISV
jgi:hypothetical protein